MYEGAFAASNHIWIHCSNQTEKSNELSEGQLFSVFSTPTLGPLPSIDWPEVLAQYCTASYQSEKKSFCNIAPLSHSYHTYPRSLGQITLPLPKLHLSIDCPELRVLPQYCAPHHLFTLSQHSSIFQYLNIALHLVIRTAFLAGK